MVLTLYQSSALCLQGSYQNSLDKLHMLDLNLLLDALRTYYSSTDRPVVLQPETFRSLMLMIDCGFTSLNEFVCHTFLYTKQFSWQELIENQILYIIGVYLFKSFRNYSLTIYNSIILLRIFTT